MLQRLFPVIVLCVSCQAALAVDRLVPQQYSTIQAAINASVNGDTITVAPGLYNEAVNMGTRQIELRSSGGAAVTTIRFQGSPPNYPQGTSITLSGGTLTGFSITGGRVGINAGPGSLIRNCRVHQNGPPISQEGVYCGFGIAATGPVGISGCTIEDNVPGPNYSGNATSSMGGGLWIAAGNVVVEDSVIRNNNATRGGAIWIGGYAGGCSFDSGSVSLTRCAVYGNTTGIGAGLAGPMVVNQSIICNNPCGMTSPNTPPCTNGVQGSVQMDSVSQISATCQDCNENGLPDAFDLLMGAVDVNRNLVPDTCECVADIFPDGQVNGGDLGVVLAQWGVAAPSAAGDIIRDGVVDGQDLAYVLSGWGPCP